MGGCNIGVVPTTIPRGIIWATILNSEREYSLFPGCRNGRRHDTILTRYADYLGVLVGAVIGGSHRGTILYRNAELVKGLQF